MHDGLNACLDGSKIVKKSAEFPICRIVSGILPGHGFVAIASHHHIVYSLGGNEEERHLHLGGDLFVISSPNEQSNDPALVVYQTVTFKKYTHPIYSDI